MVRDRGVSAICSSMVTTSLVKLQSGSGPVCNSPETRGPPRKHEVRTVGEALLRGGGEDRGQRDQQETSDDDQHAGGYLHDAPSLPPPSRETRRISNAPAQSVWLAR